MENNNSEALPAYLEHSVLKPRALYHTEFATTLENIVSENDSKKEQGILEKVFSDKTNTLKSTIKAIFNEIKLREILNSFLLDKIEDDIGKQNIHHEQLENLKSSYSFDSFMDVKTKKMKLDENMLELEKEKRKEHLECWRDLTSLKKYLLSALKDYWDLTKRREMLEV